MGRGGARTRPLRAAAQQSQNSQNTPKPTKPKVLKPADKSNAKKPVDSVVPPAEPVEQHDSDTQVEESQTPKPV